MMHILNLIFLISFLLGAGFLEIIVINEEILLMLCFIAFFFTSYVFAKEAIFENLNQRSKTIKFELLNFMEIQNNFILQNLHIVFGGYEKSIITKLLVLNLYLDSVKFRCFKLLCLFRIVLIQFLEHFSNSLIVKSNSIQSNLKMDILTSKI